MNEIREGSAKNTYIETLPTDSQMGRGNFVWTRDWSIFDYKEFGKFPWTIPFQEIALPVILRKTYEILHAQGIATCIVGLDGNKFHVNLARVPGYEGLPREPNEIPVGTNNRMVDLEVIPSFVVHPRSSLYRKWKDGKLDYKPWGFIQTPQPWEVIPIVKDGKVLFRYTTKFEKGGDRTLSDQEAKERSRLTEKQWLQANNNSTKAALGVRRYGDEVGIIVVDGKHEWMVDDKDEVRIADLIGNPYDDRFVTKPLLSSVKNYVDSYVSMLNLPSDIGEELKRNITQSFHYRNGTYQDVSKQFLRNLYEDNGWKAVFEKEKATDKVRTPPPLPIEPVRKAAGDIFLAVAQVWDRKANVRKLAGVKVRELRDVASELWVIEELNRMGQLPWA